MKNIKIKMLVLSIASLFIIAGCGSSSSSPGSTTYSTTSNKGDYSEWTLSGNSLNANWEVINSSGDVNYTYTIAATCGAADADSVHKCTISTASCADGLDTCPTTLPTGTFDMMEVPGVAMLVHTTVNSGGDELQVGFVKDANACNDDVSGDYTDIRTGIGLDDSFGMYRSDNNFLNVVHSDFGFDTTATTWNDYTSQTVAYSTNGATATFTDGGCSNGVRTRTLGADTYRSMMTASGLLVLDMPAGQGGLLSFNVNKAAKLADFANKSFGGIVFPDDGPAQPFHATFGAIVGNKIDFSVSLSNLPSFQQAIGSGGLNIMSLATPSAETNPDYADFSTVLTGYGSSPLATDYSTPKDIPGLFKIGKLLDKGRVILAAMKFNNKVIAIGMTANFRSTQDINQSTGKPFAGPGVYNSGNFILFEK